MTTKVVAAKGKAKRPPAVARFSTPRDLTYPSAVKEAVAIAESIRLPLQPWQYQVLDVGLEYEEDPDYPLGRRYRYREIAFGTPRQSGKSVITLVKLLHRMILMGPEQNAVYSMQTGTDASLKMFDDWLPRVQDSPLAPSVAKVRLSLGTQMIRFKTQSTLSILASSKNAGHGRTIDEAVLDEVMADQDDRREQAVVPAMITRPNAQLIVTSTAGTDVSVYWKRKVDMGRERAAQGHTGDVCYFEWSFPDEADPYDEEMWWEHMPSLGGTQMIAAIRHAAATMSEDEFRRAFGNQWTRTDSRVIDWGKWVECRDMTGSIQGDLVFSFDVNRDRTMSCIVAASVRSDGTVDAEVIQRDEGTSWLVPRLRELTFRHNPAAILVEGNGPGGSIIPELEREGLPVQIVNGTDYQRACGRVADAIDDVKLHVRPSDAFDNAVAGAAKRVRGDSFVWVRASGPNDISPLVCLTLAVWGILGDGSNRAMWLY